MTDAKLNKRKCKQGLDGLNVEYVINLDDLKHFYSPPEILKNKNDNTIVKIECTGGKIKAYVNVVHRIRPDNVKPFGIADAIKLELVREQVVEFMKAYLRKHLANRYSDEFISKMKVTALECNITLPVTDGATPSDVIALFDLALDKTMIFRKRKSQARYEKINTGCLYSKPKEYRLKIYDKTEEQYEKGNPMVEKNLLRIEVVFIDRSLRRMYGERRSVMDMLSIQSMETMCRAYKSVLEEDLINRTIKPCLNYCVARLLESLTSSTPGREINETVMSHKELIPDIEVLRKALKRWYRLRGIADNSKQVIRSYRIKRAGLAEGVLKTIRMFHDAAG